MIIIINNPGCLWREPVHCFDVLLTLKYRNGKMVLQLLFCLEFQLEPSLGPELDRSPLFEDPCSSSLKLDRFRLAINVSLNANLFRKRSGRVSQQLK